MNIFPVSFGYDLAEIKLTASFERLKSLISRCNNLYLIIWKKTMGILINYKKIMKQSLPNS